MGRGGGIQVSFVIAFNDAGNWKHGENIAPRLKMDDVPCSRNKQRRYLYIVIIGIST